MKLTKRIRKTISLLLAGTMAITGVNVNFGRVSAESGIEADTTTFYWEGEMCAYMADDGTATFKAETTSENMTDAEEIGDGNWGTWAGGSDDSWVAANFTGTIDLSAYKSAKLFVEGTATDASEEIETAFEIDGYKWIDSTKVAVGELTDGRFSKEFTLETKEDAFVAVALNDNNVVIESIKIVAAKETPVATAVATGSATTVPEEPGVTTFYWEGEIYAYDGNDYKNETTSENLTDAKEIGADNWSTWAGGGDTAGSWCGSNFTATVDLSAYETAKIIIKGQASAATDRIDVCLEKDAYGNWLDFETSAVGELTDGKFVKEVDLEVKEGAFVAVAPWAKDHVTITNIEIVAAKTVPVETEAPPAKPTEGVLGNATTVPEELRVTTFFWEGEVYAYMAEDKKAVFKAETTSENMTDAEEIGDGNWGAWAGGSDDSWVAANFTGTIDLSAYKSAKLFVEGTATDASEEIETAFEIDGYEWIDPTKVAVGELTDSRFSKGFTLETKEDTYVAVAPVSAGIVIRSIKIVAVKAIPVATAVATGSATIVPEGPSGENSACPATGPSLYPTYPASMPATQAPTEAPMETLIAPTRTPYQYPQKVKDGFKVGINYVSGGWEEQMWCDFQDIKDPANIAEVKGDGTYEVSYTAMSDASDILMLILSTDVKNKTFSDDFNIKATKLTIGSIEYTLNKDEGNLQFPDGNVERGCLRYNVRNPYNDKVYRSQIAEPEGTNLILNKDGNKITCENILDTNGDPAVVEVKAGDKITIRFNVEGTESPIATKTPKPAKTPNLTKTPMPTVPVGDEPLKETYPFHIGLNYVSDGWSEQSWCEFPEKYDSEDVLEIKEDGTYEVSYTALSDADDIFILMLATDIKNNTFSSRFNITATKLRVGGTEYLLNTDEGNLMFADGNVEEGCLRYNIRNPYNQKVCRALIKEEWEENCILDEFGDRITCENILDVYGDPEVVEVQAGDKITVSFKVTGMGIYVPEETETPKESKQPDNSTTPTATETPFVTPTPEMTHAPELTQSPEITLTPVVTEPPAVSPTPMKTEEPIETEEPVETEEASGATKKIKLTDNTIVVTAGKTTTVAFKAVADDTAENAAEVTADSDNTKIAKASIQGSKVRISVPATAQKGASTTVMLESEDASGDTVDASIKVYVKNATQKAKPAKKTVTIRKGKTAKVTIKVTAQNTGKATTDTVLQEEGVASVKKIATVQSVKAQRGKVIVTVKAHNVSGRKTMTVKLGKVKAKVKIVVK